MEFLAKPMEDAIRKHKSEEYPAFDVLKSLDN